MSPLCLLQLLSVLSLVWSASRSRSFQSYLNTCSKTESQFQFDNMDLVYPHICDSANIWQLAQLTLPDIQVFFDIGGNLGYTAALIFGLWSPGLGFNQKTLKQATAEAGHVNPNSNVAKFDTYCDRGDFAAAPLLCTGADAHNKPPCTTRNQVQVYSFDGEESHVQLQTRTIYHKFPYLNPQHSSASKWIYTHAAIIGDLPGSPTEGCFLQLGNEIGHFEGGSNCSKQSKVVPAFTIDGYCEKHNIKRVDVLKLDIEGGEFAALYAAKKTLTQRNVRLITYECNINCNSQAHIDFLGYLSSVGYVCYMNGVGNMVVKLSNQCWDITTIDRFNVSEWKSSDYMRFTIYNLAGNVYCGHRARSSALLTILEGMSLHTFVDGKRGDVYKDQLLSANFASVINNEFTIGERAEQWVRKTGRSLETGLRERAETKT